MYQFCSTLNINLVSNDNFQNNSLNSNRPSSLDNENTNSSKDLVTRPSSCEEHVLKNPRFKLNNESKKEIVLNDKPLKPEITKSCFNIDRISDDSKATSENLKTSDHENLNIDNKFNSLRYPKKGKNNINECRNRPGSRPRPLFDGFEILKNKTRPDAFSNNLMDNDNMKLIQQSSQSKPNYEQNHIDTCISEVNDANIISLKIQDKLAETYGNEKRTKLNSDLKLDFPGHIPNGSDKILRDKNDLNLEDADFINHDFYSEIGNLMTDIDMIWMKYCSKENLLISTDNLNEDSNHIFDNDCTDIPRTHVSREYKRQSSASLKFALPDKLNEVDRPKSSDMVCLRNNSDEQNYSSNRKFQFFSRTLSSPTMPVL